LKRSKTNSYLGGVCGGIAKATGTSALAWRLIFLFAPYSFWIYIVLWIGLVEEEENVNNI
jgi:phage shock protein PspC (stress-responsive transcriptional regulator)